MAHLRFLTPLFRATVLALFSLLALPAAHSQIVHTVHSWEFTGRHPNNRLIETADGYLYGTTPELRPGGIFRCSKNGGLTLVQDMITSPMANLTTGVTIGANGDLYGVGSNRVFAYTPGGYSRVIYTFSAGKGPAPGASLTRGPDGNFYGTTQLGGTSNRGTVYKLSPTGQYTLLHSFTGSDGAEPACELTLGSDGDFYGTTQVGSVSGGWMIFRVTPEGDLTVLHQFTGSGGNTKPVGKLVETSPGTFHGITQTGIIFRITSAGDFALPQLVGPRYSNTLYWGLIKDSAGNLYGCAEGGGAAKVGAIFKVTPTGQFSELYSFSNKDGRWPRAELLLASDGALYGTTAEGGPWNTGTIFRITTTGEFTSLGYFADGAGIFPAAAPLSIDGTLFGTLENGGQYTDTGMMYRFSDGIWKTVVDFGFHVGGGAKGQIIRGSDDFIYGVTSSGGTSYIGLAYRFDRENLPQTSFSLPVIHSFTEPEGKNPAAGLIQGQDGNLYGTIPQGGANGQGTVIRMTLNGDVTVLYSFAEGNGGRVPRAELLDGGDGYFYGTTSLGGANNTGTVFRISPTGEFSVLYDFASGIGATPLAALMLGPDGRLYGTTFGDSIDGNGIVFSLSKTGEFKVVKDFTGSDGSQPLGGLALARDGFLYGTTRRGGNNDVGVVYRIAPDGAFNVVHHFSVTDGAWPRGSLRADENGTLWGCTERGAANALASVGAALNSKVPGGGGTIFRVDLPPVILSHEIVQTGTDTAVIRAIVNPNGLATSVAVEYGGSSSYGNTTATKDAGAGMEPVTVEIPISGLTPHMTVHYRVKAESGDGLTLGTEGTLARLNAQPLVSNDVYHLDTSGEIQPLTPLSNDTDPDGDTLEIVSVGQPAYGTVEFTGSGQITYQPSNSNYTGNDQFTYTVSDGFGGTATGTITISNTVPTAVADIVTGVEGHATFNATFLTQNDSDPDNDSLSVQSVGGAMFGTVFKQEQSFTYTPTAAFPGYDTLQYVLSDGHGGKVIGTVTIRLSAPLTRTLAQKGISVPDAPQGTVWRTFGVPSMNDQGQVAFLATIQSGRAFRTVICSGSPAQIVTQTGDTPAEGGNISRLYDPLIDNSGEVAFLATRTGVLKNQDTGIWKTVAGVPKLVISEGDAAPGVPNAKFSAFPRIALTGAGQLIFVGELAVGSGGVTSKNRSGLWRQNPNGEMELVVKQGQSVSMGSKTSVVQTFLALSPVTGSPDQRRTFTDSGDAAVRVSFTDKTEGIFAIRSAGNTLELISSTGQPVSQDLQVQALPGTPSISDDGYVCFRALTKGATGTAQKSADTVVRTHIDESAPEVIARVGEPSPDIAGATFRTIQDPLLTEGGRVAFVGTVSGKSSGVSSANDTGIWISAPETAPALVVREGDEAPGTSGARFAAFSSLTLPGPSGIAFVGKLQPAKGKVSGKSDTGLWAQDSSGTLQLIVREEDRVTDNGTEKTVQTFTALSLVPGSPGQGQTANRMGGLVYRVAFTDGSQAVLQTFLP